MLLSWKDYLRTLVEDWEAERTILHTVGEGAESMQSIIPKCDSL